MGNAIESSVKTAWGMLKLEDARAREAAKGPFVNVLVIFAIAAIASAIGSQLMTGYMVPGMYGMGGGFVGGLIGGFVGLLLGMFICAGVVWVMIKLFGGNVDYMGLYKALGHTYLAYVLSVIPFLGFIGGIWALVAMIVGVRSLTGFSTSKAAAVVLIPVAILVVLAMILAAIAGAALLASLYGGGMMAGL